MVFVGYVLVLLLSFYLIARVSDEYFVVSLDKISKKLRMSNDAAGATLMAIGSSAPELFVVIIALIRPGNYAAIGMGTIVGSALFNILVIIGATAVMKKTVLSWQPVLRDTIFYVLAIFMLIYSFRDGQIEFGEAMLFVILYIVYVVAVINWRKILPYKDIDIIEDLESDIEKTEKSVWRKFLQPIDSVLDRLFPSANHYFLMFTISIAIIAVLSWVLVESAVGISHILHIPAVIVGLTILAAGTSVPDMVSSLIVAKQGRGGMAISNAIGSNIFDILFALGVPWFVMLLFTDISFIPVSTENLYSSVILLFATVLVIFFLLLAKRWKIGHRSGYFLIALYVMYLIWAISRIYM